jgi:hypothetical protein
MEKKEGKERWKRGEGRKKEDRERCIERRCLG